MLNGHTFGAGVSDPCRRNDILLAFFFLLGLLGGAAGFLIRSHTVSVMRGTYSPVSIVRLWTVLSVPFLISFLVRVFDPIFLIPVCFCRAFLFSYIQCAAAAAVYPLGPLGHWGLHSSLWLSLPLYYFFCRRLLRREGTGFSCAVAFLLVLLAGISDQTIVAPFFRALLSR